MSIYNPKITTIGGGVEIVHVIPIETEIDRAVRVFEVEDGLHLGWRPRKKLSIILTKSGDVWRLKGSR